MEDNMGVPSVPSGKSSKIVWVIVVLAVLALVVVAVVYFMGLGKKAAKVPDNSQSSQIKSVGHEITVKDISASATPDFFPKDLPSEDGAKIVKNFNSVSADGRKIGTRVYVTAKSIDDNYKIFQDYFNKNGWTTTDTPPIKGVNSKTLIASKGDMQVQVTIGDDTAAKAKTVTIIFTQKP